MLSAAAGRVNEMRAGTYVLGDRQQASSDRSRAESFAVHVAATVVSTSVPGQVVIDAGAKTLTKDRASFARGFRRALPAYPDAVIERLSDYHGVVTSPPGPPAPHLGEVVAVVPNHVCPVVDLFDAYVVARGRRDRRALAGRRPRPERLTPP